MQYTNSHSFCNCPLRSSSLLIVSKNKQTIITATDEVFNMLGYEPAQLVGKSIHILAPRALLSLPSSTHNSYTLRHESHGELPFDICVHFDPLSNATDLEYWLIRPLEKNNTALLQQKQDKPLTVLRLSPFGTIEHAYPSFEFPQTSSELIGHPIMSFVHRSDVRMLCEKLSKLQRRVYTTFRLRWLKAHPKCDGEGEYEWVVFTVMNSPRRLSCSSANDPQTRPICIVRPLIHQQGGVATEQSISFYPKQASSLLFNPLCLSIYNVFSTPLKYGMSTFVNAAVAMHDAMDKGRSYVVQFFAHMITHILRMTRELVYHSTLEIEKYLGFNVSEKEEQMPPSSIHYNDTNGCLRSSPSVATTSVKVSAHDCIWHVPLLINTHQIMQQHPPCRETTKYSKHSKRLETQNPYCISKQQPVIENCEGLLSRSFVSR